ncbi:hypothetical protein PR202_gb14364 [Eleusine coracana subsp. coracana]|uniref:Uncharacterized protein n=1 Tax=Eleusine coracana subsp. coracana TaxID=191504 RepID=A0AAV5EV60_ELECO|nr:hypothetical protein PR202_gb14364 [Eleusine coracana subsp. coracana]
MAVQLEALLEFKKGIASGETRKACYYPTGPSGKAAASLVVSRGTATGNTPTATSPSIMMQGTWFEGALSPFLGNISTLKVLYLTWNRFVGGIPPQFGRLGELQQLLLYANNFDGTIPPEVGQILDLGRQHVPRRHPPPPLQLLSVAGALDRTQQPHRHDSRLQWQSVQSEDLPGLLKQPPGMVRFGSSRFMKLFRTQAWDSGLLCALPLVSGAPSPPLSVRPGESERT